MKDPTAQLLRTGRTHLAALLESWSELGLTSAQVTPRAAFLCAALAELAAETHRGIRHSEPPAELVHAAAGLALLTKIDDQVIDQPGFHGGHTTPRAALRQRTQGFLEPTLAALFSGEASSDEGRVRLAAQVGRQLTTLSTRPDALQDLLHLCSWGWGAQVDSVVMFTAHPSAPRLDEVVKLSGTISGVWFQMIAAVGTLLGPYTLTPTQQDAFFAWGRWIQQADALADLAKEREEGQINTALGQLVYPIAGEQWLTADTETAYALVASTGADLACLPPSPGALDKLDAALSGLGAVPGLLRWIHGWLLWRYVADPRSARDPLDDEFVPYVQPTERWRAYLRGVEGG